MDVGAQLVRSSALPRVAARLATPPFAVAAIVALSSVLQTVLAWRRPTPGYFPDEYMYAELGRSLLESGTPLVRGESAHFLPLLYPLLTAPAWLWDDVEHAYRTIQAVQRRRDVAGGDPGLPARAAPAGRRPPGSGRRGARSAPARAPLLLGRDGGDTGVSAGTRDRSSRSGCARAAVAPAAGRRAGFLRSRDPDAAAAGGAAALLPRRRRRGRRARPAGCARRCASTGSRSARSARPSWLGSAPPWPARSGIYGDVTAYSVEPLVAAKGFGANALVLAYAAGWVLVPGALIGLALALARPRSRAELGFAVFAVAELVLLLLEASVVGDAGRVQERYAMYALPLLVVAFVALCEPRLAAPARERAARGRGRDRGRRGPARRLRRRRRQ